jgi:hypothetical protein
MPLALESGFATNKAVATVILMRLPSRRISSSKPSLCFLLQTVLDASTRARR